MELTVTLIATAVSIISVLTAIVFSRREKPNLMPYGQIVDSDNFLSLDFLNTSQFTIHNLTILVNGFDDKLNELSSVQLSEKLLFAVGEKTLFHYGWRLGPYVTSNFYFRVRFSGKYNSRFPIKSRRSFTQSFWYSIIPVSSSKKTISIKVSTIHMDEIEKLDTKYSLVLRTYEETIDARFSK